MKGRNIAFLALAVLFLVGLGGCSSSKGSTAPDSYIQSAQSYIDAGDLDSAIKVLQDGFSATGSGAVAQMLAQTIEMQTQTKGQTEEAGQNDTPTLPEGSQFPKEDSAHIDIARYIGEWAEKTYDYENGGLSMWISRTSDGKISVNLEQTQAYPACRIASVSESFSQDELCEDDAFAFTATDSWGIQALFKLTFEDGRIVCDISNAKDVYNSLPPWSVVDGHYTLYPTKLSEAYDDSTTPSSAFYDLIGFYVDTYGSNIFMTIEYDENDTAWVELALPIDIVKVPLTDVDGANAFSGMNYDPSQSSEPQATVTINVESGVYYVKIYIAEYDYYDTIPFVPADPADYGL